MHDAAYHHYALDYALLGVIAVALFAILVWLAKRDGDRQRRMKPKP